MALLSGDVDELGDQTDVAWLEDESQSGLRNDLVVMKQEYHYGHNSFMMASNMSYVQDIIKVMQLIEEKKIPAQDNHIVPALNITQDATADIK